MNPNSTAPEPPPPVERKRMRLWDSPRSAAAWGSYFAVACGLSMVLFMARLVWSYHSPLLWVDQWIFIRELIGNHGHYSVSLLWRQHNDHRILIPKLFYLADLYIFHGTNTFLLVVIFCVQLAHLAWLALIYSKIGRLSSIAWRTAVGLTAICLFTPRQMENFFFGSDLPLVLPLFGATVAVSSLGMFSMSLRETKNGDRRLLVLCWTAAVMAVLSFSSGLLLWPILVVLGLVWRLPRKSVVATAALGITLIGVTMLGYTNTILTGSSFPVTSILRYLLVLYANSWSFVGDRFGMVLATWIVPAASLVGLWVIFKRRTDTLAVVLFSLIGFIVAGSFATAFGRFGLGIEQARADRYQTGILLFWCCLAVLLIREASRAQRSHGWLLGQQAIIALIIVFAARMAQPVAHGARLHAQAMRNAAAAIEAGVNDPQTVVYPLTSPFNQDLIVYGNYLRSRRWSIFAAPQPFPLGRQFDRYFRVVSPSACAGAVDSLAGVPDKLWPGFRFSGWVWDIAAHAPGRAVVLIDPSGRIIGAAETGIWRPDVPAAIPSFHRDDAGYLGYVPADLQSSSAEIFVILADNISGCRLSGPPLALPLAATAYSGPAPTGVTRNMVRYRAPASGHIDTLNGQSIAGRPQPLAVNRGEPLRLEGWVLDPLHRAGVAADVTVDGVPLAIQYGMDRPDLVTMLRSPDALHGGLIATLPPLAPGDHSIAIRLVSRDEEVFYETPPLMIVVR
jgi:hypothetical protein